MYWISGAFSGVSRKPPPTSSVTPSFPAAFPPVPTAFPRVSPFPRPPDGSSRAITSFPREGVRSRRERGDPEDGGALFPSRPSGSCARPGGVPSAFACRSSRSRGSFGSSFASAFVRGAENDLSGGRSGFTGRSGTRPVISAGGRSFGGAGGGAAGGTFPMIPACGGRKSAERGISAISTIITSSLRADGAGRTDASQKSSRWKSTESPVQMRNILRLGITFHYNNVGLQVPVGVRTHVRLRFGLDTGTPFGVNETNPRRFKSAFFSGSRRAHKNYGRFGR